jgi:hypothetical protein
MPEPDSLLPSILREMRTEMSEFRAEVNRRFNGVEGRLNAVETKTDGIAVLLASTVGHLSHEMSALTTRVDALDSTRA